MIRAHGTSRTHRHVSDFLSGLASATDVLHIARECEAEPWTSAEVDEAIQDAGMVDLIRFVPVCPSCHTDAEVAAETDFPHEGLFACYGCGRAFREGLPDVCGACEGKGAVTWEEETGGGDSEMHSEGCRYCGGAGR